MTVEVVIVGGGPAGSSAAIRLARTGRKVRLYEKTRFPRPKLCGGFLSPESRSDLEDLELLPSLRRSGAVSIHRTVVTSPRGAAIESFLPCEALSVSRAALDQLMLEEARRAGVDVREGEDGFSHLEEAPCRVIAAGRRTSSSADSTAGDYGIQALFQDVQGITDQVELDLVDHGYVGVARQLGGFNVCALTTRETLRRWGPSLDDVMARFTEENPALRDHLKAASRIGSWMSVGPIKLGIRRLAQGPTFYIGDAACVVDPFVGEGMSMGLYSSRLLCRAFEQIRRPATEEYAALWREAFLPAIRWNTAVRRIFSMPILRETALLAMRWIPQGMNRVTGLTRYRRLEFL